MILDIDGAQYPVVHIEQLTLAKVLALQAELAANPSITSVRSWREIRRLWDEYSSLPDREAQLNHPESVFLTALIIWSARVSAGDDVTLLEAADVRLQAVRWIRDQAEQAEGKAWGPRPAAAGGRLARRARRWPETVTMCAPRWRAESCTCRTWCRRCRGGRCGTFRGSSGSGTPRWSISGAPGVA